MKAVRSYWFGRKRLGIGYGPRTWQGWVTVLVYGVLMASVPKVTATGHPAFYVGGMVGITLAFLAVFLWKLDTSK